jgi:hypothetical protein
MMPTKQKIYLVEGEEAPRRKTRHKGHIIKVMFLAAVARPRIDVVTGRCLFDEKIGIWPFVEEQAARLVSANRPRGTPELRPVTVTAERYLNFVLNKVMPTIKRVWPRDHQVNCRIGIQHDNAPVHLIKTLRNGSNLRTIR